MVLFARINLQGRPIERASVVFPLKVASPMRGFPSKVAPEKSTLPLKTVPEKTAVLLKIVSEKTAPFFKRSAREGRPALEKCSCKGRRLLEGGSQEGSLSWEHHPAKIGPMLPAVLFEGFLESLLVFLGDLRMENAFASCPPEASRPQTSECSQVLSIGPKIV